HLFYRRRLPTARQLDVPLPRLSQPNREGEGLRSANPQKYKTNRVVAGELRLSPFGRGTRPLLVAPTRFGRPRDRAPGRDLGARARRRERGRGRGQRSRGPHRELAGAHAEGRAEAPPARMNRPTCPLVWLARIRRAQAGRRTAWGIEIGHYRRASPRHRTPCLSRRGAGRPMVVAQSGGRAAHVLVVNDVAARRAGDRWRLRAAAALRPTAASARRCMAPAQGAVLPLRPFPAYMRRASPPGPAPA